MKMRLRSLSPSPAPVKVRVPAVRVSPERVRAEVWPVAARDAVIVLFPELAATVPSVSL